MLTQGEFLRMMVDLKAVESLLKVGLNDDCRRDKIELAAKNLLTITKRIVEEFWKDLK